jgi:ankyrin repeat protein
MDDARTAFIEEATWHGSRGWRAIHHAIRRDNDLAIIDLLLDHGADPTLIEDGRSAVSMARRNRLPHCSRQAPR